MKEKFEAPEIEAVRFEAEDIIRTSGCGNGAQDVDSVNSDDGFGWNSGGFGADDGDY